MFIVVLMNLPPVKYALLYVLACIEKISLSRNIWYAYGVRVIITVQPTAETQKTQRKTLTSNYVNRAKNSVITTALNTPIN
ncbi:MAG: hypothetical protein DYG83_15945 [Candidatus Brocadia sp. AMX2]|nr:MAG: hypothetical protein EDM70_13850 [Candidatus Brocadia sp. AMX2]MBC6933844.1 hypothetical protein [Candidatus Brocadia sp.]MBL1168438.1 hypothetical protein [Candidatus Brocadia sp. AMX1]MCE7868276.1 hypothetical protein [Candidatus Brocadia sp. AMX2]MCQ3918925.1 hypothetical protein [Candidatus Brocadia sp.]